MRFKPLDVIFILIALALSASFFLCSAGSEPKRLLLTFGEKEMTLPYVDGIIDLKKYTGKSKHLEVKGGKARMLDSECPNQICVKTGEISDCGDMIICLPDNLAITIDCEGALK